MTCAGIKIRSKNVERMMTVVVLMMWSTPFLPGSDPNGAESPHGDRVSMKLHRVLTELLRIGWLYEIPYGTLRGFPEYTKF